MVAHDMCSPLTAVNLSLAILQSGDSETISESSAEKLSQAGSGIEQLVQKANGLLSIERLCANSPDLAFNDVEMPSKNGVIEPANDENINELSRLIRIEFRSAPALEVRQPAAFVPAFSRRV